MRPDEQRILDNLYFRYQSYDNANTKYSYDISYTTLNNGACPIVKIKRGKGLDNFRKHIDDLRANIKDLSTIIVSDYSGVSAKCKPLNEPVEINMADNESTPRVIVSKPRPNGINAGIFENLIDFCERTEFGGLGALAPVASIINDKHVIARYTEKNDELKEELKELKAKHADLQTKYETLNHEHEQLQWQHDELEDELNDFHEKNRKEDKFFQGAGAIGGIIVQNLIRKNASALAGILPAELLAGITAGDAETPDGELPMSPESPSPEQQERLNAAAQIYEWLQTLNEADFSKVYSIIQMCRQNIEYADHIIYYLNGNKNQQIV